MRIETKIGRTTETGTETGTETETETMTEEKTETTAGEKTEEKTEEMTEEKTKKKTRTGTETITKKKTRGKKKKGMLIAVSELEALLGVHRRTIGRWIKKGKFPCPFKIDKTKYWSRKQLNTYFRKRGIPVFNSCCEVRK